MEINKKLKEGNDYSLTLAKTTNIEIIDDPMNSKLNLCCKCPYCNKNMLLLKEEKINKYRYCCVPDMVLSLARNKKVAIKILSEIWDKRHKGKK